MLEGLVPHLPLCEVRPALNEKDLNVTALENHACAR